MNFKGDQTIASCGVTLSLTVTDNRSAMQGNCSSPAPDIRSPPLMALRTGQCILSTDNRVFDNFSDNHDTDGQKLLLRNIYLRALSESTSPQGWNSLVLVSHSDGSVWLEDVALQGQWLPGSHGYWVGLITAENTTRIYQAGAMKPSSVTVCPSLAAGPSMAGLCCTSMLLMPVLSIL
jgi:hypothetical protein